MALIVQKFGGSSVAEAVIKKIVIIFFILSLGLASASGNQWHWIRTIGLGDGWVIEEGMADVIINGENFSAKLYLKDKPKTVYIFLKGVLKKGKLKVTQTVPELNAVDPTYTGTYYQANYKGDSDTRNEESINLSNKQTMIGLTRSLSK